MKEQLTNRYKVSKTLRFSLIPQGKTEEYINSEILENDFKKADAYAKAKKIIDRYHINLIEEVLSGEVIDKVILYKYYDLFTKSEKTPDDKKNIQKYESDLRKYIVKEFSKNPKYKNVFKRKLIIEDLPQFLSDENEKEIIKEFQKFTTYFQGFYENRKNMYSDEKKSTAISYRIINQNLPKFINNIKVFNKIKNFISEEDIKKLESNISTIYNVNIADVFGIDYFNYVASQKGIDMYNQIIGGYSKESGEKVQGLNEYINLYNQKDKSAKLPKLTMLYKQILSDRKTLSFIPEAYKNDNEVLKSIKDFYKEDNRENKSEDIVTYEDAINKVINCINTIDHENYKNIYVKNDLALTEISNLACKSWSIVSESLKLEYEKENPFKGKNRENYDEKRSKFLKSISSYSLEELERHMNSAESKVDIIEFLNTKVKELKENIINSYNDVKSLLDVEYPNSKKLIAEDEDIEKIKTFLDSIKIFEKFISLLKGTGKEFGRDLVFYGEYENLMDQIRAIDTIYNKVRNYVTQKPYSKDKIKLNFNCPTLLAGWDRNKENSNLSVILKKEDKFYLAIMNTSERKSFEDLDELENDINENNCYEKMEYKLVSGASKMLPKVFFTTSNKDYYAPSSEIERIHASKTYNKGIEGEVFNLEDCHKLIDFYKESINKHEDWVKFNYVFSDTKTYKDISYFYNEVDKQSYKMRFRKIDCSYIDNLVEEGKLYLFQIYNKDFSEYSKGKPNLHTMYFKELFSEDNLKDVVFKLNGDAEVFYREASIKEQNEIFHEKGEILKNKNPLKVDKNSNLKDTSVFDYKLIKDRRFTKRQFGFHLSMTLNFKAEGEENINNTVRKLVKESKEQYVIGIDRGERHLIYVTVVDSKGNIVEQYSLNQIINSYKDGNGNVKKITTDYHKLLDQKEKERNKSKKDWKSVESIKELKEGYISQVVHQICKLVEKYDALIIMEDLNSGFKNSRIKVEKQVYQKFEKMLIDKLNFYASKDKDKKEVGGLLNAYQLTNKFESFQKMGKQNGIIFYIPAWLTSKIDPTTGFVDLMKPKYKSIEASKHFISKFDNISFNKSENYFEFEFNYDNFDRGVTDFKKNWTICTYGIRIENFRNPENNSQYDSKEVDITNELISLFESKGIDYKSNNLKQQILEQEESTFFKLIMHYIKLCLQMRNSKTGTDIDYLISPVKNNNNEFYDSRNYDDTSVMPANADANGAYHIAKKGLWAIEQIRDAEDITKVNFAISNSEWLKFTQSK